MTNFAGPSESALKVLYAVFGGHLSAAQMAGLSRLWLLSEGMARAPRAYLLATVFHETAQSMQPIREWGRGKGRAYGVIDHSGKAPYGRGYVQITWRDNYLRADRALGLQGRLAADYDLALDAEIAGKILKLGMIEGWFTGKRLADYLQGDAAPLALYAQARRIVNGRDRAAEIAAHALVFEAALRQDALQKQKVGPPVPRPDAGAERAKIGLRAGLLRLVAMLRLGVKT